MKLLCRGHDEYGPCGQYVTVRKGVDPYCPRHRPGGPLKRGRRRVFFEPRTAIHLHITEALKAKLELVAQQQRATFSDVANTLLEVGVDALLQDDGPAPPMGDTAA
jgi:hypothetical protein